MNYGRIREDKIDHKTDTHRFNSLNWHDIEIFSNSKPYNFYSFREDTFLSAGMKESSYSYTDFKQLIQSLHFPKQLTELTTMEKSNQ